VTKLYAVCRTPIPFDLAYGAGMANAAAAVAAAPAAG
jgi:hypothetical protein